MAQVQIGNMMQGILNILKDGDRSMQQAARMICREGCVVPGRHVQRTVRNNVPVLQPKNAHGFPGIGITPTRAKYPLVAGELRDSIYFTNKKRGFNWKKGSLKYVVGFPHAKKGQWTPGWYAHWVEFGHWQRNQIVYNDKTGYAWPLKGTGRGKKANATNRIRFVQGQPFMASGIAASEGAVPAMVNAAMKKQLGIEIAKLALR